MHPWRERLHRWFAPAARRCPLSPNAITILALILNVFAAWLLFERRFLVALVFIAVGGLADAFDGIVARVQEKSSRYGDFLDHFCDRLSDSLVVIGWLLGSRVRIEIAMAGVLAVMLNGYIRTQIEATWRERKYDSLGRGEFVLALIVLPILSHILTSNGWDAIAPYGLRIVEWMSLLLLVFATFGIVQSFKLASRLERDR
ncbi:MAG TPA: CDP-alcohol phosphatidyltransferase family protein [Thermoanaerobaculia bacterium]|jgi:phosphatidylglycerophosphate synthase|nr:CDP-alcohol phosphatidyltransferase family protein [Thermoanaerobaculia bacterium]